MSIVTPSSTNGHGAPQPSVTLHQQPAFIVGSVRSGTTLLRLMLDHHPEIAFHFEFEFVVDKIASDGSFPDLAEYHEYLSQHRIFQLSEAQINPQLDYRQLVNSFLEQKRRREDKSIVGATIHHHIDRIPFLWPGARYIHLLRDGRDVARSCQTMGWAGNMYFAVERWIEAETVWKHLRTKIAPENQLEVRYENLIKNPEQTLSEICQFLGTRFDAAVFDYTKTSTYDRPDASLIEQWKRKLSDHEIQLAESRIHEMLVERGYELSGLPILEIPSAKRRQLARQDRFWRAQFRARRYGLPLFAVDYHARRLPLKPLRRWCQAKINEIENSHVR